MENKVEIINVVLKDRYTNKIKLRDSFGRRIQSPNRPPNKVVIHAINADGKVEFLQESKNLVIYQGREWVAERLFDKDNGAVPTDPAEAIYWFGVGSGGASGDPLVPVPPTNSDTDLGDESPITSDSTTTIYADWHDKSGTDYWFKHPFDTVEFEQDPNNDNEYLIVKVTTTLATDECNIVGTGSWNDLSEAGLFISDSDSPSSTIWTLFARVTFSTIQKTSSRSLVFTWYIYV
jgi:hypothetical protein